MEILAATKAGLPAYWRAAASQQACGISWWVLAGVSRTEGRHGTYGGARLGPDGDVSHPIIGIALTGSNGITWPSLRYPGGNCIAAFWPDVVPIPTQGGHFAYHWNGTTVDYVKQLDTGVILHVL